MIWVKPVDPKPSATRAPPDGVSCERRIRGAIWGASFGSQGYQPFLRASYAVIAALDAPLVYTSEQGGAHRAKEQRPRGQWRDWLRPPRITIGTPIPSEDRSRTGCTLACVATPSVTRIRPDRQNQSFVVQRVHQTSLAGVMNKSRRSDDRQCSTDDAPLGRRKGRIPGAI